VRRPTAIVLVILFVLLAAAAVLQLTVRTPAAPFPGPVSGTPLPPASAPPS
jgi:hypothetical protein